jgi:beta-1,4-N-acetylglucosaminyltransferase
MTLPVIIQAALLVVVAATLRLLQLLKNIRRARVQRRSLVKSTHRRAPIKTLVVLGSGGHTTEMISLIEALDASKYSPISYCKATSDTTSLQRLQHYKSNHTPKVFDIPRAREVGQSYMSSILTTCYAQLHALSLIYRIQPQLLLCNGPGTCLPLCLAALALRFFNVLQTEIVFCESLCRVQTLSMTGKLLYCFADVFLVHWPELQAKYSSSQRIRAFVP